MTTQSPVEETYRPAETQTLLETIDLFATINRLEQELQGNEPLLNQLALLRQNLQTAANFLGEPDHQIAFIGSVGVGKTTAICKLLGLIDDDKRPALSTASGRTTLCEVEVRNGESPRILVEPCSEGDVKAYIREFAELVRSRTQESRTDSDNSEHTGLSSEMERCLRNMTKLPVSRTKGPDGKVIKSDAALDSFKMAGSLDQFIKLVEERMRLPQRTTIEISFSGDQPLEWLRKNFETLNHGRQDEMPMPRRIIVEIPNTCLTVGGLDVAVVDTKGLDGSVEREDIDRQFQNPRVITVLCTKFNDAPEQAIQDLMRHLVDTGMKSTIADKTLLLVLDRHGEAEKVLSEAGPVSSAEEGRLVREDQIQDTLRTKLKLSDEDHPRIGFLDAENEDGIRIRSAIADLVEIVRARYVARIQEISQAVHEIADNRERAIARAAFETVSASIHSWAQGSRSQMAEIRHLYRALVDDMTTKEVYASSIRASVNRRGSWDNFDFYYKLAMAARKKAVTSFHDSVEEIAQVLRNLERQEALRPALPFIRQLQVAIKERMDALYELAAFKGRTAFEDKLRSDGNFWHAQQDQWGRGPGYKGRVAFGTEDWFQHHSPGKDEEAIELEVFSGWVRLIDTVESLLLKTAAAGE